MQPKKLDKTFLDLEKQFSSFEVQPKMGSTVSIARHQNSICEIKEEDQTIELGGEDDIAARTALDFKRKEMDQTF